MAHVISLQNVKGGVTKTTSSVNIATGLARTGRRVLLIDVDPQSNSTYTLIGILSDAQEGTLYEVIIDNKPLASIIKPTQVANLSIAPGTIELSSADLLLAPRPGREWQLQRALEPLQDEYDYVIIDTPPTLNLLSVNSLAACTTGFILPVALDLYAFIGIRLLENTLADLRQNLRVPIPMLGVLAALKDNTIESRERLQAVQDYFKAKVFETVIPRNIVVAEANDPQRDNLYEYAPKSAGAQAYTKLVEEIIARVEQA